MLQANLQPADPEFVRREQAMLARLESIAGTDRHLNRRFTVPGVLASAPRTWPEPDSAATARLGGLETDLAAVTAAFPEVETEAVMCRHACGLLEAAWRERVEASPLSGRQPCDCALCACLPAPPVRTAADYGWRRSEGLPLAVKTWPYRRELWREQHLAALLLCRVQDDMTDVRADAVTGEISNFWLSAMSTHDKALYAACAIAHIKFGCTPEAHGLMWNTWLTPATIVWQGLTGRHALWFDGIPPTLAPAPLPAEDCLLCGLHPNACAGLFAGTVTLTVGPRPAVAALSEHTARLADRCQRDTPHAWPLLRSELAAFEALHGPWHGNIDSTWEILSRTYLAAVTAENSTTYGRAAPLSVQTDSAAIGAELFHTLNQMPTAKEDTALLAFMFGCAHPHFLWNCLSHSPTSVHGDWLDG